MSRRLSKPSLPGVFEEKKTRSRCEPNEGKENHFERNTKDLVLRLSRSDHGEGKNFLLQSQRLSCNTQNPTSCLSLSLPGRGEQKNVCASLSLTIQSWLGSAFFGLQPVCRDILPRPAIELFSSSASCCYFLIIFGNEAGSHGEKLTVSASLARFVCFATQL
jgi:hypothetical protein